ncbi:MAG: tyrosine-type recombinase/integrase [Alphaproteobacteria bacterium]|nr:tyrosine-type recombinase/integrase [Alphaproteobacteria bacterium]
MVATRSGRITATAVVSLPEGTTLRDETLGGFGVRRRSGTPSYFLQTRINGRLKWITIGKHGAPWTPTTARQEALRLLSEIAEGADPTQKKHARRTAVTLDAIAHEFLNEHGVKLKARTLHHYTRVIEARILPALGTRPLREIARSDVSRLHAAMVATPRQANLTLAVLSKLMNWCEIEGLREPNSNPCRHIKKYREASRQRFLSDDELDRLGHVLKDLSERQTESPYVIAAIRLLLLTGARLGEILTLEWRFIDLQRGLISLPDSKTGQKAVFLNEAAVDLLRTLSAVPGNPYVLVGAREGGHLVNLQKPWRRIRRLARLEDVRIHDLRHSFASIAAAQGASLQLIGRLLGHASTQTTQRYAHLVADQVKELNETVGKKVGSALGSNVR